MSRHLSAHFLVRPACVKTLGGKSRTVKVVVTIAEKR
jgi:hypothetical protein